MKETIKAEFENLKMLYPKMLLALFPLLLRTFIIILSEYISEKFIPVLSYIVFFLKPFIFISMILCIEIIYNDLNNYKFKFFNFIKKYFKVLFYYFLFKLFGISLFYFLIHFPFLTEHSTFVAKTCGYATNFFAVFCYTLIISMESAPLKTIVCSIKPLFPYWIIFTVTYLVLDYFSINPYFLLFTYILNPLIIYMFFLLLEKTRGL